MSETDLPISSQDTPSTHDDRERAIATLVDRFYTAARSDPLLGPVFERRVSDWDRHLSTMRDFWSSAVCQSGRYAGRPLDVHRRIPEIRAEHFPRWLSLWHETVDEVVHTDMKRPLKEFASRMAAAMPARMDLAPDKPANR